MNTRTMACALLLGACGAVSAQDWNTGGNFINTTTQYLGCDASSTQPLRLKTEVNQPIEWYTDGIRRMLLQESLSYTIGPFPGQNKDGALLICPKVDNLFSNGAPGPYSLLHLAATDDNAQMDSYRPWMNTGVTFTGNHDHAYIGQKYGDHDETDLVIHWSDNADKSPFGPDLRCEVT